MRMIMIPIIVGALGKGPQKLEKKTGGIGNRKKNRDHALLRLGRILRRVLGR